MDWNPDRREFGRLALGGALGSAFFGAAGGASAADTPNIPAPPTKIKICAQSSANPTPDQLRFLRQLGVGYVSVGAPREMRTAEGFAEIKRRYAEGGVTVYNIGNTSVHNMPEVTLNLPGRDEKIEEYKNYIRNLGKAGIHYTTYAHMGNGIWSSGRATLRDSPGREYDRADPNKQGTWDGKTWKEPLSHGRVFTKDEIWENYTYFIRQVAPVAEEQGVKIGVHPDDPPEPVLAGVPRCIFSSYDGYKRAFEIAKSPNVGICLCCGCWLEGGPLMGKDPVETIRSFKKDRVWKIHFRNVSAPLPHFIETLMDDGYYEMSKIMKALVEIDFEGIVILDHTPSLVGGGNAPLAYGIAYMTALLHSALREVKGWQGTSALA